MLYLSDECITVNPLLSLQGGLIVTGGLFEMGGGGVFNLEKTMVSVLHK